ncbi:MAG: glycosyltransferase, partial [Chloroflexi bacterium]|nr:glycosyltransferase [Chloroflexota bacterium]
MSVIIPAYNSATFLPQAIASVFAQDFKAYEIIIVDDGSTDNTQAVLQPFADRIRYVLQVNAGSAAARNTGIEMARGKYIVLLDADDLLLPGKFREQVEILEKRPSLGLIHSGWRIIDESGTTIKEMQPWHDSPVLNLETWLKNKPVKMGAMLFRREWLERVGGLDPELRQSHDVDLLLRLSLAGCTIAWLKKPTMCYRHHATSTIRKNAPKQVKYVTKVLDKFFDQPNVPAHIRNREHQTRYYSNIWLAWHLYRSQFLPESAAHLQLTLDYANYSPTRILFDWVKHFAKWSEKDGLDVAAISVMWPYFAEAADLSTQEWEVTRPLLDWWLGKWPWQGKPDLSNAYLMSTLHDTVKAYQNELTLSVELFLEWWLGVWFSYIENSSSEDLGQLSTFAHLSSDQIVNLAQVCILLSMEQISASTIARFWQDVLDQGLVLQYEAGKGTALFATYSGQSLLRGQWRNGIAGAARAFGMGMGRDAQYA